MLSKIEGLFASTIVYRRLSHLLHRNCIPSTRAYYLRQTLYSIIYHSSIMRVSRSVLASVALLARSSTAFFAPHRITSSSSSSTNLAFASSRTAVWGRRQTYYSKTTTSSLHAKVVKLSDPQTQLLQDVDIFIFDCDGVIWRVRRRRRKSE